MFLPIGIGALFGVQLPIRAVPDGADHSREIRGRGVDGFQIPGGKSGMLLTLYFLIKGLEEMGENAWISNMCLVPSSAMQEHNLLLICDTA